MTALKNNVSVTISLSQSGVVRYERYRTKFIRDQIETKQEQKNIEGNSKSKIV